MAPLPAPPGAKTTTTMRHASYADLDHVFSDAAASSSSVFPTPTCDCGPIVCPVLISRSHSLPYLQVLTHLAARGYTVLLIVDDRNHAWCEKAYGDVFSIERVPSEQTEPLWAEFDPKVQEVAEHGDKPQHMARLLGTLASDFASCLYGWTKKRVEEIKPSLVVCDVFYGFVADLCDELNIPYVATSSGLIPGMAETSWTRPLYSTDGHPTTLKLSLAQRLYAATLEPATVLCAASPAIRQAAAVRKQLGVTAPRAGQQQAARFRGRLTLINTFWGHETARPLPANIRLIGPVRSHGAASSAQRLEGEFAAFMEAKGRERIVLLSFGQNCSLTAPRMHALVGGLRRLLERKVIDGAIWSVSMTPEASLEEAGLRDAEQLCGGSVLVTRWCPQKALLEDPRVKVFVSHGGTESCSECFYASKPVLSIPHFSDQPHNSRLIEEAGAGIVLDKRALTAEKVERALERIVGGGEESAAFAQAARRMRALAVSSGRLATERAADEVELVLHYGDGHLQEQGDRMSWAKRQNYDMFFCAMAALGVGAAAVVAGAVASRRRA